MSRPRGPNTLRVAERVAKEVSELACAHGLTNDEDEREFQKSWNKKRKIIEGKFGKFSVALEFVFRKLHARKDDVFAPNQEFFAALSYGRSSIQPDVKQWANSVAQLRRRVQLLMASRNLSIEESVDEMLLPLASIWSRESNATRLGADANSPFIEFAHLALSRLDSPIAGLAEKVGAEQLAYRWRRIKSREQLG